MVGGVQLPIAACLWLPPLPPVMVLPHRWGPSPAPLPTTVTQRAWPQSFVTCHKVSPSMGGISPACHNKVYYENRLVWDMGTDRYTRVVWLR